MFGQCESSSAGEKTFHYECKSPDGNFPSLVAPTDLCEESVSAPRCSSSSVVVKSAAQSDGISLLIHAEDAFVNGFK